MKNKKFIERPKIIENPETGQKYNLSTWAKKLGLMKGDTVLNRLNKYPPEIALSKNFPTYDFMGGGYKAKYNKPGELAKLRKKLGKTQKEVSAILGISVSALQRMESGKDKVKIVIYMAIHHLFVRKRQRDAAAARYKSKESRKKVFLNRKTLEQKSVTAKDLKSARAKTGLSQDRLVKELKIGLSTYQRMESGKDPSKRYVFFAIKDLIRVQRLKNSDLK